MRKNLILKFDEDEVFYRRPIEILIQVEEVEDWEFPNEEMEFFPYRVIDILINETNDSTYQ